MSDIIVTGIDQTIANLRRVEAAYIKRLAMALEFAADMLVNYIKVEFDRPATGRGFTDRTTNLRNSISRSNAVIDGDSVVVWVYAGEDYAIYVELHNGRIYAFMLPALNDKRREIFNIVKMALRKVA